MKVKKAIKKVVALGIGVSMLGATLIGATASDLGDYPVPYVKDGMFNGLMVVGDDAAPADIIGVTDIAMSLQYSSTIKEVISISGDSGVELSGDTVKIARSGDVLEVNELLGDVVESLDSSDAEALKSFTVSNDKGTTDVNQYLRFDWGSGTSDDVNASVIFTQNEDEDVGDFLKFEDGDRAFQYEMEFEENFESDIDGSDLPDLEDETLHILGEDFVITDASLSASSGLTLNLMGGAIHDTIEEGETKTYTLRGKEYEVTALIISDWAGAAGTAKVKLKVNGEVTNELQEGNTEILNDGTTLGIREVLPNEAGETSGGDIMEFYLGANKIQMRDDGDNDWEDGTVKINEETIDGAELQISYTNTSDEVSIEKISYRLNVYGISGDSPYIADGEGLRDYLDEPEGMLGSSWDITYRGLSNPGVNDISIKSSGDEYTLSFTNNQGIEYNNINYLHRLSDGNMTYGDDGGKYFVFEQSVPAVVNTSTWNNCTIKKKDSFVVGHATTSDTGITRVMKFNSVDVSSTRIQLTDEGTGGSINAQYNGSNEGQIRVGGYDFDFVLYVDGTDQYLCVDLDDDDVLYGATSTANIVVNGGGIISLSDTALADQAGTLRRHPFLAVDMSLTTDKDNFDEAPVADEDITVSFVAGSSEMDLSIADDATIGLDMQSPDDNSDTNVGMTKYGVKLIEQNEESDPNTVDIEYPLAQLLPQVFVTFEKTVTLEGGAGTITVERPQRIEIGSAVLSSQVSDPTAANVISVGGPCINSVTAEIMGLTYPACGADSGMSEGEGIVKLYESGDKVAIVVAGWEAEDTTRATRVLANYKTYQESGQLVGTEVSVTGTSATEFSVTPVSGEAAEEPAEE